MSGANGSTALCFAFERPEVMPQPPAHLDTGRIHHLVLHTDASQAVSFSSDG
jgi:hypothetical protein